MGHQQHTTTFITIGNMLLEDFDVFVYFGCVVTKNIGTVADVFHWINMEIQTFYLLNKIWNIGDRLISGAHKISLYNASVKTVLLYKVRNMEDYSGCSEQAKQVFSITNKWLKIIVRRLNVIRHKKLLELTQQSPVDTDILWGKWERNRETLACDKHCTTKASNYQNYIVLNHQQPPVHDSVAL